MKINIVFLHALVLSVGVLPISSSDAATFLGLAIDGSGSIDSSDFELQRNAYSNVLATAIPTDGSIGIGVWLFGSSVSSVFSPQLISSQSDLDSLIAGIGSMVQPSSNTALGPAIATAATSLLGVGGPDDTYVIDVSTDGVGNVGINAVAAATDAIGAGIDNINGLGIGSGAILDFVMGPDSFGVQIDSFQDMEAALAQKISTEIGNPLPPVQGVPEPSWAFATSFAGLLVVVRRRRRSSAV